MIAPTARTPIAPVADRLPCGRWTSGAPLLVVLYTAATDIAVEWRIWGKGEIKGRPYYDRLCQSVDRIMVMFKKLTAIVWAEASGRM